LGALLLYVVGKIGDRIRSLNWMLIVKTTLVYYSDLGFKTAHCLMTQSNFAIQIK
jgi:hypothetical protein